MCADNELLVFTTPAYMLDATVKDVYDGAYNMVEAILETIEDDRRKWSLIDYKFPKPFSGKGFQLVLFIHENVICLYAVHAFDER